MPHTYQKPPVKQAAFSLLELVVVILVVGILAAVAIPRFGSDQSFEGRAAAAELVTRLRLAQQLAMNNTRRSVSVSVNGSVLDIQQDGASLSDYPLNFADEYEVSFSNANLVYNSLGETTNTTITLSPGSGVSVCIEASGYAWLC